MSARAPPDARRAPIEGESNWNPANITTTRVPGPRQRRPSYEVKSPALEHIRELQGRIAVLREMKADLEHFVALCHGDDRLDRPILDGLADLALEGRLLARRRPPRPQ